MKRVMLVVLVMSMVLQVCVRPACASNVYQNTQLEELQVLESKFPKNFDYTTSYVDQVENKGEIRFSTVDSITYVEVYLNDVLTQRVYASPKENVMALVEYTHGEDETKKKANPVVQIEKYTDYVGYEDINDKKEQILPDIWAFYPEDWAYLFTMPSNIMVAGSKPCSLYTQNYDEEPDSHRYTETPVSIGPGSAIGIVVSVFAMFLTGELSLGGIATAFATSIIGDAITNGMYGEVCFSTQKILYAPVINGVNIFPDAYITKRWTITYDAVHKKEMIHLDNPSYRWNRGETPHAIVANAQTFEASYG